MKNTKPKAIAIFDYDKWESEVNAALQELGVQK